MNKIRPDGVNPDRKIMSMNNHTLQNVVSVNAQDCYSLVKTLLLIATGLSISFYGVLSLSSQKKETKSLSCFSSGDLTIIHTMNLVTLESRLFSRRVFVGCVTKVL